MLLLSHSAAAEPRWFTKVRLYNSDTDCTHLPQSRKTAPVRLSTMSASTFGAPQPERPKVASVAQAKAARRAACCPAGPA